MDEERKRSEDGGWDERCAKGCARKQTGIGKTETLFNLKEVDGKNARVRSEEGSDLPYDLLVAVPPHKGMEVIEKNGLGQNGWIPTNRNSLHMDGEQGANVIVLGDTTNIPISKAGSTAHFEADAAAENVAAVIKIGRPGALLRRQGVLLHRGRQGSRHLRDVHLQPTAAAQGAQRRGARVQDGLQ